MGHRLLITEAEKVSIQYRYGMKIAILEQTNNLSKEDIIQKLDDTFDIGPKTKKTIVDIINKNFGKMNTKTLISVLLPILISMTSCQNTGGNSANCDDETQTKLSGDFYEKVKEYDYNKDSVLDDFEKTQYARGETDKLVDSLRTNVDYERLKNSEKNSGVEIKNISFPKANEYSDYDCIKFSYKNNSGKDIEAISFVWFDLKDIFGEPIQPTYESGYDEDGLKNGRTGYGKWDILEKKVKSGKVYVGRIMFTDGTKWENEIK